MNRSKTRLGTDSFFSKFNLELPILASYNVALNNKWNLRINAGPYLSYAMFGRDWFLPACAPRLRASWYIRLPCRMKEVLTMLEYRLEPEGGLLVCALGTLEVGGGQIVECSLCLSDILPERRVALAVELLEGEQLRGTRLYTVPPHHEP